MTLTSKTFGELVTFARASTGTRFNSSGVMVSEAVDAPRFDHDPGASNAARGLLIEGQRTNLILRSNDLSNASWAKLNATAAQTATDLFGNANSASTFTVSSAGGTGQSRISQAVTISGTNAVICAVLKAVTAQYVQLSTSGMTTNPIGRFDLGAGTVMSGSDSSARIMSLGSGRYCCWLLVPVGADPIGNMQINAITAAGGTSVIFDGGSFEVLATSVESGNFPTSYIPTVASQVTRSKDEAIVSGTAFSDWFNASEGTFYVEFTMLPGARPDRRILSINDGTDNERMTVTENGSAQLVVTVRDGGVDQASMTAHTITDYAAVHKLAFAFKANDFAVSVNGAAAVTDSSGTVPTVDRMHIASDSSGANQGQCHIRKIRFYPTRKTNAELAGLTA